jgi:hypothetical protein
MSFDDQAVPDDTDRTDATDGPTPDDQDRRDPDYHPDTDYQALIDYQPPFDYEAAARADATRIDPAFGTDEFASWYRRDSPQETVQVTPTESLELTKGYQQSQGYQLPPVNQGGPSGPPFPAAGPPPGNGRRGLFAVIAVIAVLAAGGGAYALARSLGQHTTSQPPVSPATQAATSSGSAATSSGSASPAASLVSIGPGVPPSGARPTVVTLLGHYFDGINKHDYAEYAATLNPAEQAKQPQSTFDSGYSSTADSGMTLTSLASEDSGGVIATVTFTSRQSPAQSVDSSACNDWTLSFYLVTQGTGFLIGPAPSSYKPSYSDC